MLRYPRLRKMESITNQADAAMPSDNRFQPSELMWRLERGARFGLWGSRIGEARNLGPVGFQHIQRGHQRGQPSASHNDTTVIDSSDDNALLLVGTNRLSALAVERILEAAEHVERMQQEVLLTVVGCGALH